MHYSVIYGSPDQQKTGCVIVGVYDRRQLSAAAAALDRASNGAINAAVSRGDLDGKAGQVLVLHDAGKLICERVLLVGLGRERDLDAAAFNKALAASVRAVRATGAASAVSYLTDLTVKDRGVAWKARQAVLAGREAEYRFDECRGATARSELPKVALTALAFSMPRRSDVTEGQAALREALAIADGMDFTRDLGNTPPNICTPIFLAKQAAALARQHKRIKTRALDRAAMAKLGMGSFLAVAQGSVEPPKLIVLEYLHGKKGDKPVALVGKGITFDTGGISIKPSDKMDEMKFDMCGGATVLGVFKAVAELALPINLVGVVPSCENMPSGAAVKPGDIVKSMAGITIEILNTDAEGRLILCDALTYVEQKYAPSVCIDIATLTGAIVVALGGIPTGLFSNDDKLQRALLVAGEETGDRAWPMPLWPEYEALLKSEHADIANISGGRDGGAITAASFLHKFARKMKWAHLDIAATAWKGKRATGRPVPLLVQYLLDNAPRGSKAGTVPDRGLSP